MQFTVNLKAGLWQQQQTRGRFFLLRDTGVASSIQVRLDLPGQNDEEISEATRGFNATINGGVRFENVFLRSDVDTVAKIVISDNDLALNFFDGAAVLATIAGLPLPVSNDRGSPGNLLYVSGVSISDAPATALNNAAAVACGPAAVVIAAANAARRTVRFANLGPDAVALGGAGLTWAQRVIVLAAGDVWVEERGGNLAWSAITDAGKAASVTRQELIA